MMIGIGAARAFVVTLMAGVAQAASVTFEGGLQGGAGYTESGNEFDDVRIVNGNCDSLSGRPCAAFNDNEVSTMKQVGGGTFDFMGFWFQILGRGPTATGNTLSVMTDFGTTNYSQAVWGRNGGGQYIDTSADANFMGISFARFSTSNGGNVRVDDITLGGELPLPAAGGMLLFGLGGLTLMRRRKRA